MSVLPSWKKASKEAGPLTKSALSRVTGLIIESEGPEVSIGQVCSISSARHSQKIEAQVVGFRETRFAYGT